MPEEYNEIDIQKRELKERWETVKSLYEQLLDVVASFDSEFGKEVSGPIEALEESKNLLVEELKKEVDIDE
jgi:archaellum component FlaC